MNVFIVFIKFLGWIVAIWVKLVRLIEEKEAYGFERGPTTKIISIITKKKIALRVDPGPLCPHLGPSLPQR